MSAFHGPDHSAQGNGLLDSSDYMGAARVTHGATSAQRFEAAASQYPTRTASPRPLEVSPGRPVSSLRTVAECDAARVELTAAIVCIEGQVDAAENRAKAGGEALDHDWHRRARGALRAKKAALTEVEFSRGALAHAEKENAKQSSDAEKLKLLAANFPTVFAEVEQMALERGLLN